MKTALIDGDSIIYIIAWKFKDHDPSDISADMEVRATVDQLVQGIFLAVDAGFYMGVLGHDTHKSFRYEAAKYKPYKGTRREKDQWVADWEPAIRDQLLQRWKFGTYPHLEADDLVALAWWSNNDHIVCSPDKDLRQLAGTHFDYKKTEFTEVSKEQADYNLAFQMLVGDTSDNVAGLPGYGEKKAREKLTQLQEHQFPIMIVQQEYLKYFGPHYGQIIFEENLGVLELMNPLHKHYNPKYSTIVESLFYKTDTHRGSNVFSDI